MVKLFKAGVCIYVYTCIRVYVHKCICAHVHMCICVYVYTCICEGQRSTMDVFCCSPLYILRQGLLLNLELPALAILSGQLAPGICLFLPLWY